MGNSLKTVKKRPHTFTGAERAKGGRTGGGGRPTNDAKAMFLKEGPGAFRRVKAMAKDQSLPAKVRLDANKELLNRAHGQPKQSVEVTSPEQAERVKALEQALAQEMGLAAGAEASKRDSD